jgi:hypothetical protein
MAGNPATPAAAIGKPETGGASSSFSSLIQGPMDHLQIILKKRSKYQPVLLPAAESGEIDPNRGPA